MLSSLRVLLQIAFRNLFASPLRTLIVGGIIFFGSALVTVGGSMLDSVVSGMSRSIIGTLAGDIQVYSARSKEELAIFGGMGGAEPSLEQIEAFEKIKTTLEQVPNVAQVIPMGISSALVTSGNSIDVALEKLRNGVRQLLAGNRSPEVVGQIASQKQHVQQIVDVLQSEQHNGEALVDQTKVSQEDRDNALALNRAANPAFWQGFDGDPLGALEFLENRIAPQSVDADLLYLRYVGTDIQAFRKAFERFKIVYGSSIPPGQRGFLFSQYFYEERVKLRTARRLDKLRIAIREKGQHIAKEAELQQMVRENRSETREILLQLDRTANQKMSHLLQAELGSDQTDLGKLLATFFNTDDQNFEQRYQFFYQQLAPLLELYRIRVGDTLTIKSFTKTGYSRSVNLKVYGTFEFTGLEKSPLAGSVNVMDLVSFRDLYGFLTADSAREVAQLKAAAGGRDIERSDAEEQLFGAGSASLAGAGSASLPPSGGPAVVLPDVNAVAHRVGRDERSANRSFDPGDVSKGVVLNAAVILKDHRRLGQSLRDIAEAAKRAGLELRVVGWKDASGLIGNLVLVFQVTLFVAVLVIFLVALVVINNALVMATLERVREIGTLRAVGAQRTFILGMLVIEAATIGAVFGALGAAVGALVIVAMNRLGGIPASNDLLNFFFSGPSLRPVLNPGYVAAAIAVVLVVATASSLYPAWLAMRISPREAMGTEE